MKEAPENRYDLRQSFIDRIQNAIEMNLKGQIKKLVPDLHASEQAELIYSLNSEERDALVQMLDSKFDPAVLVELSGEVRNEIISYLGSEKLSILISKLESREAADLIDELEKSLTQEALDAIKSAKRREEIEEILSYDADTVGRLMSPKKYVAIPKDWTAGDVIKFLRKNKNLPSEFYDMIVVDEYFRPISSVSTGRILRSASTTSMDSIMKEVEKIKILRAEMDQAEAARIFIKYDLNFAPVVDDSGILIGVIYSKDIIDVIQEESEEDLLRMGKVSDADMHSGILKSARGRFPWLLTAILTTSLGSFVIHSYESTIEKMVAVAVLMPIIAGLGGVAGNQTLTVLVRNLATKEVNSRNAFKNVLKEIFIGISNGLCLGVLAGSGVYIWSHNLQLSSIFGATVLTVLTLSGTIGSIVPLMVTKLKLDPAVTSGAFITTTIDILSFLTFLKLVTSIML